MKNYQKLLLISVFFSGKVVASPYAIQLEASMTPQSGQYGGLSSYGEIFTEPASNGYIRTRLGPYESRSKALGILDQVHQAGYPNAILVIQKKAVTVSSSASSNSSSSTADIANLDVRTIKEWNMLTPEQQSNLVYLDGKLHIKNGAQFISLSEITQQ